MRLALVGWLDLLAWLCITNRLGKPAAWLSQQSQLLDQRWGTGHWR